MLFTSYLRLPQEDLTHEGKEDIRMQERPYASNRSWKIICAILSVSLVASAITNVSFALHRQPQQNRDNDEIRSQYAGLSQDTIRRVEPDPKYFTRNRTAQDAAWENDRLEASRLYVALDESYAVSQGLPHAMRWPWDQGKGVYLLAAGHQMHCVHALRSWINDKEDGKQDFEMRWDYNHALHCLNTVREAIMCSADDIPLYTGRLHDNVHYKKLLVGRGMLRKCRNWDALRQWADERSACYSYVDADQKLDKYKHCPDGSRPWEQLAGE